MVKKYLTGFEGEEGKERLFAEFARITIQVQMKKRNLGYREFTDLFNEKFKIGINERNMRNKIARGTFSASFFLMCMHALDCTSIALSPDDLRMLAEQGHDAGDL